MTKAKTKTITVKVDDQNPQSLELLATSIIELSEGVKKLLSSRITRNAIVVLLKDSTGLSARDINNVLEAVENLKKAYTK